MQRFIWPNLPQLIKSKRSSHPAVITDMEICGKVRVLGMVEKCDTLHVFICDGAGVIYPFCSLPENLLFVDRAFGVADGSAAVIDTDGFGHSHTDHSKRSFSKRNFVMFWL